MSGNDIQTKGKKVLDRVWAYSLGNTARTIRHSDISVKHRKQEGRAIWILVRETLRQTMMKRKYLCSK